MSFGLSVEKKKKHVIRYRTYQPGSVEFRIISREKEKLVIRYRTYRPGRDKFRIICWEKKNKWYDIGLIGQEWWVSNHQPRKRKSMWQDIALIGLEWCVSDHLSRKEKASSKISDISCRSDEFRIINRERKMQVIRYQTYWPRVKSFGSSPEKRNCMW